MRATKPSSPTDRSKRAQEILRRRTSPRNKSGGSGEEESVLELTPTSTLVALILLLAIGASMATSYIIIHNPGCMKSTDVASMNENLKDSELPRLRADSTSGSGTTPTPPDLSTIKTVVVASAPQDDQTMPATCTAEQVTAVKSQLIPAGCTDGRPWRQLCSWTLATTGCQDHYWMREFYAKTPFGGNDHKPFVAIFVGWGRFGTKSGFIMHALALGSRDAKQYDVLKFEQSAGGAGAGCPKKNIEMGGTERQTGVKVFVLEDDAEKVSELNRLKDEFKADNELVIASLPTGGNLDNWVDANLPGDDPIYQLSINSDGGDFDVLMGSSNALKRTRYLDFDVNWKGGWKQASLCVLIRKLKTRGFVCYFSGVSGELWRVTDCWLSHYANSNWGRLACVNAHHADVKELLDSMEGIFAETLKKQISYG